MAHPTEVRLDDPRRKTYLQMARLIKLYKGPEVPGIYTDEFFLSICWEETQFINTRQITSDGKADGVGGGFGQVEAGTLSAIIKHYKMPVTLERARQLMEADAFSVRFMGRAVQMLHENFDAMKGSLSPTDPQFASKRRRRLMNGYGGFRKLKVGDPLNTLKPDGPKATQAHVDDMERRGKKIDGILKCTEMLERAPKAAIGDLMVPARADISAALWEARLSDLRGTKAFHDQLMERVLAGIG